MFVFIFKILNVRLIDTKVWLLSITCLVARDSFSRENGCEEQG